MIEAKLECKNVSCEKLANRLSKFRGAFPFGYKVWAYKDRVFAYFRVRCIMDLNEFTRRLRTIKNAEYQYHKIERVPRYEW
ncbi:MAG: hypothetical protein QMD36_06390 [Candidatus Aenigmarchaeota archaeon]|nr:hypothetical protein [Candidatus Aenigmarchaeota archaeon]